MLFWYTYNIVGLCKYTLMLEQVKVMDECKHLALDDVTYCCVKSCTIWKNSYGPQLPKVLSSIPKLSGYIHTTFDKWINLCSWLALNTFGFDYICPCLRFRFMCRLGTGWMLQGIFSDNTWDMIIYEFWRNWYLHRTHRGMNLSWVLATYIAWLQS